MSFGLEYAKQPTLTSFQLPLLGGPLTVRFEGDKVTPETVVELERNGAFAQSTCGYLSTLGSESDEEKTTSFGARMAWKRIMFGGLQDCEFVVNLMFTGIIFYILLNHVIPSYAASAATACQPALLAMHAANGWASSIVQNLARVRNVWRPAAPSVPNVNVCELATANHQQQYYTLAGLVGNALLPAAYTIPLDVALMNNLNGLEVVCGLIIRNFAVQVCRPFNGSAPLPRYSIANVPLVTWNAIDFRQSDAKSGYSLVEENGSLFWRVAHGNGAWVRTEPLLRRVNLAAKKQYHVEWPQLIADWGAPKKHT